MKKFLASLLFISLLNNTYAQNESPSFTDGFLKEINYSKPFLSELHSTLIKMEIGYQRDLGPYNLDDQFGFFNRPVVDLHLGFDAPLYSINFGKLSNGKDKWGIGLSLPVSVHILEDMWEPITAAVIDVDYRFGSPRIRAIRNFEDDYFIKNMSFSWLPLFHECTHLGDELVLGVAAKGYPLKRVNVSYEYTEFQMTINDPNGSLENNHSFRLSGRYRVSDRGYGWFGTESFAVDTTVVNFEKSTHRFEFSLQYQLQRSEGFLASKRAVNYFSFDASSRVKLGIPVYNLVNNVWVEKDRDEKNVMTFNSYFGWKFFPKENKKNALGFFVHYYRGLNFWGQLRNQGNFEMINFAITYEP